MRRSAKILAVLLLCEGLLGGCAGRTTTERAMTSLRESDVVRTFEPVAGGRWIGNAVAYGPHRDGQAPGGDESTLNNKSRNPQFTKSPNLQITNCSIHLTSTQSTATPSSRLSVPPVYALGTKAVV